MNKIISEFFCSLQTKASLFFIICFFNILAVAGIMFSCNLIQYEREITNEYNMIYDDWKYLNTGDLFEDAGRSFFNDRNWLVKLKAYNHKLHDSTEFQYLEIYDQPIYCNEYKKDEFLQYYTHDKELSKRVASVQTQDGDIESFYCLQAVWLGLEVFEQFNIQIKKGSLFQQKDYDYVYGEDSVILLGAEYEEFYQVGDTITLCFPFAAIDFNAKIIGILPRGSNIDRGGRLINLDRRIIIPQYNMEEYPSGEKDQRFQESLYLNKNSGVIATKISANSVQDIINKYNSELDIFPNYYVTGTTNQQSAILKSTLSQIAGFTLQIVILFMVVTTVFTIIYIYMKINKSKRYFAILLINGFTMKELHVIIMLEIISIYLISLTIGMPIGALITLSFGITTFNSLLYIIIVLVLCLLTIVITSKKFNKLSIVELLR